MGEVYFYYGKALLELARLESGVLGNALDGGESQMKVHGAAWDEFLLVSELCSFLVLLSMGCLCLFRN